jgi:peptidoglycan hydrolase-like protein with peptidoglycan-binding domain
LDYPTNTGKYGILTQTAHEKYTKAINNSTQNVISKASNTTDIKLKSICDSLYQDDWKVGTTGLEVRQLQQCLIDQNLLKSKITGRVGSLTLAALDQVKPKNTQISPNGILKNTTDSSNLDCNSLKRRYYKIGAKSDEITALQKCMTDAGIYKFKITGLYGYVTDAALVKWKKR